jgi:hypothetical protein
LNLKNLPFIWHVSCTNPTCHVAYQLTIPDSSISWHHVSCLRPADANSPSSTL